MLNGYAGVFIKVTRSRQEIIIVVVQTCPKNAVVPAFELVVDSANRNMKVENNERISIMPNAKTLRYALPSREKAEQIERSEISYSNNHDTKSVANSTSSTAKQQFRSKRFRSFRGRVKLE